MISITYDILAKNTKIMLDKPNPLWYDMVKSNIERRKK